MSWRPTDGLVTAIALDEGQSVAPGAALATIIPKGSVLEAHLLVPSNAVGFIKAGQQVRLRIDSFPYQKFGQVAGTVIRVDDSPINDAQPNVSSTGGPVFRIRVRLVQQSVAAYGVQRPFKAGVTLEADILQDRRRVIEWVIDPLISAAKGRAD